MANLVNNLIVSDDNLQLTEKELLANFQPRRSSTQPTNNQNPQNTNPLLETIMGTFKSENDKLWNFIKKSENNAEMLKSYFDRVLENRSQHHRNSTYKEHGNEQKNVNNINTYPVKRHGTSLYDIKEKNSRVFQSHYQHRPFAQQPQPQHQTYKEPPVVHRHTYNAYSERRESGEDRDALWNELRRAKRLKEEAEANLDDLQRKLDREKKNWRNCLNEKDGEINDLVKGIERGRSEIGILKREVELLKNDNRELKDSIEELLSLKDKFGYLGNYNERGNFNNGDNKKNFDFEEFENFKRKKNFELKEFEDENDKLKDEVADLKKKLRKNDNKREMEELEEKNKELVKERLNFIEEIDGLKGEIETIKVNQKKSIVDRKVVYDNIELLKCVYVQATYIEQEGR